MNRIYRTLVPVILASQVFAAQGPLGFEKLMNAYPDVRENYAWQTYQRGDFLVIGADALMDNPFMGLYREFKERQGFRVTMTGLSEAGNTSAAIKDYIADFYSSHALEYVLLVGDVTGAFALPSYSFGPENDVTDLPYVLLEGSGDDYFPEAFIGRWPVDTQSDLAVIVNKTIQYASNPYMGSDWMDKALVVAGNYADTGTILTPVWTSYWLRDELDDYGYTQVDTVFFPPVTQPTDVLNSWNSGVGIVNYRGWGDAHGWHYPHFHVSDFDEGSLSNGFQLPIVFSFVCGTGKFDSSIDPSFCEAMLTLGTFTAPAGAVAVVAPSDLHTRTKFNNALNTTLWDALLEGRANELGPALLACKFGFLNEFTDQTGPGEMAEFYYHTYNIIGDPSLPIWLGTPDIIDISAEDLGPVFWDSGLITMTSSELPEGVFALRHGEELVGAGRWTDGNIRIYRFDGHAFYDPEKESEALEITLNVPGHVPLTLEVMPETGAEQCFAGFAESLYPGIDSWSLQVDNHAAASVDASVGISIPGTDYNHDFGTVTIPAQTTLTLSPLSAPVIPLGTREQVIEISIDGVTRSAAIPLAMVHADIELDFGEMLRPIPGESFEVDLSGVLVGMPVSALDLDVSLSSPAEFASLDDISGSATLSTAGELVFEDARFSGSISDIAPGSRLPLHFDFTLAGQSESFHQAVFSVLVGSVSSTDPTPPCEAGYWAYDNTDVDFAQAPEYNWLDLSEEGGATHVLLGDDDHTLVDLPFTFRYFGVDYNNLTINSNGWAAFGPDYINYFRNWSIPMPLGADAMMAPFWDDLDNDSLVAGQEQPVPIDIYYYQQIGDPGAFIVQWDEIYNGFGDRSYTETFQLLLYDPASMVAEDGNGIIEFQYSEVHDVDQINNYTTVGIESPDQNDGLQYVYNRVYAPGATELGAGLAIRFTTDPPDNYWASISEALPLPQVFKLGMPYPNPFNPEVSIPLEIKGTGHVSVAIYNLRGQLVREIDTAGLAAGTHRLQFNAGDLAAGLYLVRAGRSDEFQVQKITLLK